MHIKLPSKRPRIPFFRIFYSTTFTVLTLVLAAALIITPGDNIYQSFRAGQINHIFFIAGFYLLTLIVAVLFYGGRLYATRSALASIPREWSVTEGKGVGMKLGKVGREIQKGLERSVWIAYEARPRDLRKEEGEDAERMGSKERMAERPAGGRLSHQSEPSILPAWGTISHPGWSSPSSPDLPNLHYEPVILELANLIEAKAVSLAPPDPLYDLENANTIDEAPSPDPLAVELLQRPATMGLRDYITHLTTLGMISSPALGGEFLAIYEQARFSNEELNELEFRGLMSVFAEILRSMKPLDPSAMDELHVEMDEDEFASEGSDDANSFLTNDTVEHTPQPDIYYTPRPDAWTSSSGSSISSSHNGSQGTIHTAPRPSATRNQSNRSRASDRRRGIHTPSIGSLRRIRSGTTSSGYSARSGAGSVIRLAEARTPLDLPYEYFDGDEGV